MSLRALRNLTDIALFVANLKRAIAEAPGTSS